MADPITVRQALELVPNVATRVIRDVTGVVDNSVANGFILRGDGDDFLRLLADRDATSGYAQLELLGQHVGETMTARGFLALPSLGSNGAAAEDLAASMGLRHNFLLASA